MKDKEALIFPDKLMIRDTKIHDDLGGLGQRIYTTAGQGYKKVEYIRADLCATYQDEGKQIGWYQEATKRFCYMDVKVCNHYNDYTVPVFVGHQDEWINVETTPECKEGGLIYIQVATKNQQTGKYIVYGGVYLNKYELMDINDDEIKYFTGFHCESKHSDFDQYFEPIKPDFWQYFAQPPTSKNSET